MATIGSSSPLLYVEGSATQTGASGTKRTIKITAKFKVNGTSSASFYGYPCNWRARVGSDYGSWTEFKASGTKWYGNESLRTFTQTLTVDVGTTSSKSITVGIYVTHPSYSDSSKYWVGNYTWTFKVGSTNSAPKLSGTITADGSTSAKYIPENQTTIKLTSPTATDAEGNLSGYRFAESKNGGSYSQIYKDSSKTYTRTISGGEGTTYKYSCYAYDSAGETSSTIYSALITKNTLTGDTLASSNSIAFSTNSISFTYSGAKNTNGNTSFTRKLTCSEVTVYNQTVTSTPITLTIYKSGTVPTTPYIKFSDLKSKFASSSYKGNLTFTLTTTNAYGTSKTSSKTISVNLQTKPNGATDPQIIENISYSTMYRPILNDVSYFLPDGNLVAYVSWTKGSGNLGEAIAYDVYVAYGSGSWQLIASNLTSTNYSHKIPKQTVSQQFKYLIRTKCVYNTSLYVDSPTPAKTLHYWNQPSLVNGTVIRTAETAEVPITVKTTTSLINVETRGTWKLSKKGTIDVLSSGDLSITQSQQKISLTGLEEESIYDLVITFKDNTTLSSYQTKTIQINANKPVFFVNKYGVGVNGEKATADHSFIFKGNMGVTSPNGTYTNHLIKTYEGANHGMGVAIGAGGVTAIGGGESAKILLNDTTNFFGGDTSREVMAVASDNGVYVLTGCQSSTTGNIALFHSNGNFFASGQIFESSTVDATNGGVTSYTRVYSPNNKPTPADIGALPQLKTANGYPGLVQNSGADTGWIRTTQSGLIPYSNGTGALGTSSWRFSGVHANSANIYGATSVSGNLSVSGTSTLTGTVSTGGTVQVGGSLRLGNSNKEVAMYSFWSDNAHHDFINKSASDEIKFGPAKQTFDSTTMLRGTCVRIYAHAKAASGTSGVFLGSSGSTAITSDENLKDVFDIDDRYMDFFDNLKPVLYKYKGEDYHRLHVGYGARATEKALLDANVPTEDFGGIVKEKDVVVDLDGSGNKHYEDLYSLRYEEFIGINTLAIKRNKNKIEELENTIKEMEKEIEELKSLIKEA